MSTADIPEHVVATATGNAPAAKQAAMNPFDDGPTTLLDAANELCRWYMRGERDDYHLLDDHHGEWLRLLDEERKLVLNCHRDGLKTTTVLCYLALRLEYDDGFRAIWAMNNKTMAKKKTDLEFNRFVERNPWLTNLQEADRVTDTIELKEFVNGSTLTATWLDGGIDGDRAHLLVLDDLIKARGDGQPEDVHEWVEGTATPMVKDNGRTVLIGTRKRPDDIYQHYRSMPAYSVAEYPALLDVWEEAHADDDDVDERRPPREHYTELDGQLLLWPEARDLEWLQGKRDEMDDHRWRREYCLVAEQRVGAVYDLFDTAHADAGGHVIDEDPERVQYWFATIDWGSSNPAGMLVWARTQDERLLTLDEAKYPVDGTQDYVDQLETFADDFGRGRVYCDPEDKRGIDDLCSEGFDATDAVNDVDAGIRKVKDLLREGRLFVHERCGDLLDEIGSYRWNQQTDRPVKKDDHLVDSWRYGAATEEWGTITIRWRSGSSPTTGSFR